MLSRSVNPLLTFPLSYHVTVIIYVIFRPIQGRLKSTILWIFTISSLFMLSRSRNLLLRWLLSHDVWVTSIIKVNFRFERCGWFCLMMFSNFHAIHVFKVRESIADISTELPCLGDLENPGRLPFQQVLGGTGQIGSKFISSHTTNALLSTSLSCHVMSRHVTSRHVTSRHVTSRHVTSRHVTSCHVMSRHVTSCHVMLRHVTSCHIMPRHVTSCHVESCGTVTRTTIHCQLTFSTRN